MPFEESTHHLTKKNKKKWINRPKSIS